MDQNNYKNSLPEYRSDDSSVAGGFSASPPRSPFLSADGRRRTIPPKLYRIGEVVAYSGMSRQTIHNYTTMGLLIESRWTQGGHRLYDESVFERLDRIAELRAGNKGLQEIRDYFEKMYASESGT